MTTDSFVGGLDLRRGDGATPTEAFTTIEEVISLSGLGSTRSTIEVTHFSSPGNAKEFIGGRAEGSEITFECNYLETNNAQQQALIADVDTASVTSRNFEFAVTDGTNTTTYSFSAAPVTWELNPDNEENHTISFTFKITGEITKA